MMKNQNNIHKVVYLLILAVSFTFCSENDDTVSADDPSNLAVEIVSLDNQNNSVALQASAKNTSLYQFYVGDAENPEEINATGYFEYIFEGPGSYTITTRAYGASGRYIKAETPVNLAPEAEPVPLSRGYTTPLTYAGYNLVWQDEFNGSGVNNDFWTFETGDGCPNNCGWGNNEEEYYRSENAWVADDVLTIEARKESAGSRDYTSARLKTQGKKVFQYGRIDIRALLPKGQGMWPALWLLGQNITSVGWPGCGEIDIMEMIGGSGRENTVYGTAHWEFGNEHASYGLSKTLPSDVYDYTEAYHVFTLIWDENTLKWFVDDVQFTELNITDAAMSEFHQPHFFIFNVAVGGNWPGSPNSSTVFPQQMKVDYVRVFQQQ